jgi:putative NADH-flavin reductase
MIIALFGGTGTAGNQILAQALAGGHQLRCLVRNADRLGPFAPQVETLVGNVGDRSAVETTITGSEVVISALGGTNRRSPDVLHTGYANILDAMGRAGVSRLVAVQGFHLPFPNDPNNAGQRLIRRILGMANAALLKDSLAMAELLSASDTDWTLVRAPRIKAVPATGRYRSGRLELGPWNSVSAGDVARFALQCATTGSYHRQAPMIAGVSRGERQGFGHDERVPNAEATR